MYILALDSTAKIATVAVCRDGERLAQYHIDNGHTHSELLLPMAQTALAALGLTLDEVGLLACAVGPGSFTGVRIGTALVKGIAFGRDIPCVAVSTLEALAENVAPLPGLLVPVMDARRQEVYTALFSGGSEGARRISEDEALPLAALAEKLRGQPGVADGSTPVYLVGDGYGVAYAALREAGIPLCDTPPLLRLQNAASVAAVAYRRFLRGGAVGDREINPTYLRVPQAVRERNERLAREAKEGD